MATTQEVTPGLTLDAGALVAIDHHDRRVMAMLALARANAVTVTIPAGVLAQVWRDGRRQARIARLLSSRGVEIEPLDKMRALEAGQLCGMRGTSDVIDASVVLCAKARGHRIISSDVDDLGRLDPTAIIIRV
jgi:hypothetical protein